MKKTKRNKPSIYDIAKAVGVSAATVSYVINGKNKVSEKTRTKVLKTMNEMGYVADNLAVSLSRGKSGLVGVCFPLESSSNVFSDNPFYSEFLANFEREISYGGYNTIVGYLKSPEEFERWLISRHLEGLVLFGLYSPEIFNILLARKVPFVLADFFDPSLPALSIRVDDESGGRLAGRHLIGLGHRRIAFVGGNLETSKVDSKRLEGLNEALKEAGCPEAFVIEAPTTFDGGYAVAETIAKQKEITAVFCGSDIVAIGLMRRAQELGLSIPEDLSVVGFDNLKECDYVYPALTTIAQDIPAKGKAAADALMKAIGGEEGAAEIPPITPRIVIRNSTAMPRD